MCVGDTSPSATATVAPPSTKSIPPESQLRGGLRADSVLQLSQKVSRGQLATQQQEVER